MPVHRSGEGLPRSSPQCAAPPEILLRRPVPEVAPGPVAGPGCRPGGGYGCPARHPGCDELDAGILQRAPYPIEVADRLWGMPVPSSNRFTV
jgi:hypothetical protein